MEKKELTVTDKNEFLTSLGIKLKVKYIGNVVEPYERKIYSNTANKYKVTLKYKGKQMTINFIMGSAYTNPPTLDEIFYCLIRDKQIYEFDCSDVYNFAKTMGLDSDSIQVKKKFEGLKREVSNYDRMFYDIHDQLVELYDNE